MTKNGKTAGEFSAEAKILGVKLKAGAVSSYNRTPNKIEIGFEIEMPIAAAVRTRKQWESASFRSEGMPYDLADRKSELRQMSGAWSRPRYVGVSLSVGRQQRGE